MKRKPKLVEVCWLDCVVEEGWTYGDDKVDKWAHDAGAAECWSIGYLLHRDKDAVTLATTIDAERKGACNLTRIPRRSIVGMRLFEIGDPE